MIRKEMGIKLLQRVLFRPEEKESMSCSYYVSADIARESAFVIIPKQNWGEKKGDRP